MGNMKNRIITVGIIFSMIITMIPQRSMANDQIKFSEGLEIVELTEPTNDNGYVILTDVVVLSELMDDGTVKIILTNMGAFVINEWALVYEASYDIMAIENAELVMNSEVKEIKCINKSDALESNECVNITLDINGEYS